MSEGYIRIDYTYGAAKPPIWFTDLNEAQKEVPVQGAADIFVVAKSGVRAQDKYWYSSAKGKWERGRVTG